MSAQVQKILERKEQRGANESRRLMLDNCANEVVFALVGYVGSGNSKIGEILKGLLADRHLAGGAFDTEIVSARQIIRKWAEGAGFDLPFAENLTTLDEIEKFQNAGDKMREKDHATIAKQFVAEIRRIRAEKTGTALSTEPVAPDGKRRAYILDSIRHPAEVQLLRHIYQDAFILVGIVCDEDVRRSRLSDQYEDAGKGRVDRFISRDSKDPEKHGQRVSDAFHLSDFFLDNTESQFNATGEPNRNWNIADELSRLIKIVTHSEIVRPRVDEAAMFTATAAKMKSACLSRQVGAALIDPDGNVVSVGSNEVPKPGGGVYGEGTTSADDRCAFRRTEDYRFCSNVTEQNEIIDTVIESIPELSGADMERKQNIREQIRKSRVGSLIEFSRAVHAEMAAILSATRQGMSTSGTRLFVTTFPCHYCARHIVAAGIDEVQYVEPYFKSKALELHDDSITTTTKDWQKPSERAAPKDTKNKRVLFRPFTGVSPRMFDRAFVKDRELKNEKTGHLEIGDPDWGTPWHLRTASYAQLEAILFEDKE